MNKSLFTYKKSGVNIKAADNFVKFISNFYENFNKNFQFCTNLTENPGIFIKFLSKFIIASTLYSLPLELAQ